MQTKEWALLLEGVCRVSVDSLVESGGDYTLATVTQLEPEAVPIAQQQQQQSIHSHKEGTLSGQEDSPEVAELASQLRATTAVLLKKLM